MRPTYAYIDPKIVGMNLQRIREHIGPNPLIMAIVKADAYGHGALKIAKELERCGADAFGVATGEEAMQLRNGGISLPILILGAVPMEDVAMFVENDISLTVWYQAQIEEIARIAATVGKQARVHLKIDTGMGRIGLRDEEELMTVLRVLSQRREIYFEGMFTHFATADADDEKGTAYMAKQVKKFEQAVSYVRAMGLNPVIHCANSATTLHHPELHFNMVRPGYALYGYDPGPGNVGFLIPAMKWVTQIVNIKWIGPEECVSYGITYKSDKPTMIATIPVGYADGYTRAIGNHGYALVHGKKAPVVGRVCMDQCMLDVTGIPMTAVHDEVVLLGKQGKEQITADDLGAWTETIGYEILTGVGQRVRRIYE